MGFLAYLDRRYHDRKIKGILRENPELDEMRVRRDYSLGVFPILALLQDGKFSGAYAESLILAKTESPSLRFKRFIADSLDLIFPLR